MIERQVLIPADPERLWDALTEPERVSTWMGETVEWELVPGGRARFTTGSGAVRHGRIEEVVPVRHLRFRWWPEGDADDTSEVTYQLDPDDDGTRLTITERPVPAGEPAASARAARTARTAWTAWDSRLFGICAQTRMAPSVAACGR